MRVVRFASQLTPYRQAFFLLLFGLLLQSAPFWFSDHAERDQSTAHVRHHFPPGRRQNHPHREDAPLRGRGAVGRFSAFAQEPAGDDFGLDGTGAQARHLGQFDGTAVRLRGVPDQPARHPGAQGFLRGHVPRAHRRGRGGDGARRSQGHRGADAEVVRGLPPARRADLHVHQQVRPAVEGGNRVAG